MSPARALPVLLLSTCCVYAHAQQTPAAKPPKTPKGAYYIDATKLNAALLLPEPAAVGSAEDKRELAELHRLEKTRTPAQIAAARADEAGEDIFAYRTVFGAGFTPEALPITAAVGMHVKNEQSVAGAQAKLYFHLPRPYQEDKTLHPVCALKEIPDSYPSGHALTGYLEALTLAEMMPEKRAAIMARADDYAHNRMVCGVHRHGDVEASRMLAYAVFGYMLSTPKFQHDVAQAAEELHSKLGMPAKASIER